MFQILSKCLLALLLCCFFSLPEALACIKQCPNSSDLSSALVSKEGTPIVEILVGARGSSLMSWTPFGSAGEYSVSVTDLTAFVVITSFSTTSTSATINGLISGHTYRYSVTDGVDFIIEDVVH